MKRVRCFLSYTPGLGDEMEDFLAPFVEDGGVSNRRLRELVKLGVLALRQGARVMPNELGEPELVYVIKAVPGLGLPVNGAATEQLPVSPASRISVEAARKDKSGNKRRAQPSRGKEDEKETSASARQEATREPVEQGQPAASKVAGPGKPTLADEDSAPVSVANHSQAATPGSVSGVPTDLPRIDVASSDEDKSDEAKKVEFLALLDGLFPDGLTPELT